MSPVVIPRFIELKSLSKRSFVGINSSAGPKTILPLVVNLPEANNLIPVPQLRITLPFTAEIEVTDKSKAPG